MSCISQQGFSSPWWYRESWVSLRSFPAIPIASLLQSQGMRLTWVSNNWFRICLTSLTVWSNLQLTSSLRPYIAHHMFRSLVNIFLRQLVSDEAQFKATIKAAPVASACKDTICWLIPTHLTMALESIMMNPRPALPVLLLQLPAT